MIPSDLPPVSHPEPRSLGENGNYGDVPSILQHAEQLMRSQLLGQLPQQQLSQLPQLLTKLPGPAPDQLQMLQSLQQFGQRQKEVRDPRLPPPRDSRDFLLSAATELNKTGQKLK